MAKLETSVKDQLMQLIGFESFDSTFVIGKLGPVTRCGGRV